MHIWYDAYGFLWILFYGIVVFVPFFLLGKAMREGESGKIGFILAAILIVMNLMWGVALFSLIFSLSGLLLGRFAKFDKKLFHTAVWIGIAGVLCDTFWPSRLVFFSPLTINRPTLMRLTIGILTGREYTRGRTLMFQGEPIVEQEATLFGKYPILVGYPNEINMPRVELQIVISILIFMAILFVSLYFLRRAGKESRRVGLAVACSIYAVLLLPIHGFILITMVCGALIGRHAARVGLVPPFLQPDSISRLLLIAVACIAGYHLTYAESLIDGFGYLLNINYASMYSSACLYSLVLGMAMASPPSLEEARAILEKADHLAELNDPMPAMQFMSSPQFKSIPSAMIGPGGPLHDRLLAILSKIKSRIEDMASPSKHHVERNWENLPSIVVIPIGRYVDSRDIVSAAKSSGKDLVCLMPLGADIKAQDAHRLIELSYEFADDPRLALAFMALEFKGLVLIRSSFLLQHGSTLSTHTAEDLLMGLLEQAEREGWRHKFVER